MTDKRFRLQGTKEVSFEIFVIASSKTAAIKKARSGDVVSQKITYCPNGFRLTHDPKVKEIAGEPTNAVIS